MDTTGPLVLGRTIDVHVTLAAPVHQVLEATPAGITAVERAVSDRLSRLVGDLGLSAPCTARCQAGAPDAERTLTVQLGAHRCVYPRTLERRPSAIVGTLGWPWHAPVSSLRELLLQQAAADDAKGARALVAELAAASVVQGASALVDPGEGRWPMDGLAMDALGDALRLGLRVRLPSVAEAGAPESREDVIDRLTTGEWQVLVHPGYLQELLGATDFSTTMADVHRWVYEELGVRIPRLSFEEDATLPERGFAFCTYGVVSAPFVGLRPTDRLVVDPPVGIEGEPAMEPASGEPATVVPESAAAYLRDTTADVIDPIRLIAGAAAMTAYARRACLVTRSTTRNELDRFLAAYPAFAEATDRLPLDTLTAVRRQLVQECVSVRDLRTIVQTMLDERERLGRMPGLDDLVRSVRSALRSPINRAAARGADHLARIDARPPDEGSDEDDLVRRAELAALTPGGVLVTEGEHRAAVRAAIAAEYPALYVLATEELVPEAFGAANASGTDLARL